MWADVLDWKVLHSTSIPGTKSQEVTEATEVSEGGIQPPESPAEEDQRREEREEGQTRIGTGVPSSSSSAATTPPAEVVEAARRLSHSVD